MSKIDQHKPTRPIANLGRKHHRLHVFGKSRGWRCYYCGRLTHCRTCWPDKPVGESATRDHYVPRARAGSNAWANLRLACFDCNGEKADTMPGDADE